MPFSISPDSPVRCSRTFNVNQDKFFQLLCLPGARPVIVTLDTVLHVLSLPDVKHTIAHQHM